MELQNVTISVPKDVLRKAKHLAIDRRTSLSGLLTRLLEDLVVSEETYDRARTRQLTLMAEGLDLALKGETLWKREDLHAR